PDGRRMRSDDRCLSRGEGQPGCREDGTLPQDHAEGQGPDRRWYSGTGANAAHGFRVSPATFKATVRRTAVDVRSTRGWPVHGDGHPQYRFPALADRP